MKVEWLQRQVARPGQLHAFTEGATISVCGVQKRKEGDIWKSVEGRTRCASCHRKVNPETAPKAPKPYRGK